MKAALGRACRYAGRTGAYLDWAVEALRICSGEGRRRDADPHFHMCYSEFNRSSGAIAAMDTGIISIETSRSRMELLDAFKGFKYPNEIGPASTTSIRRAFRRWVMATPDPGKRTDRRKPALGEPDCGLKTRKWEEVRLGQHGVRRQLRQQAWEPPETSEPPPMLQRFKLLNQRGAPPLSWAPDFFRYRIDVAKLVCTPSASGRAQRNSATHAAPYVR